MPSSPFVHSSEDTKYYIHCPLAVVYRYWGRGFTVSGLWVPVCVVSSELRLMQWLWSVALESRLAPSVGRQILILSSSQCLARLPACHEKRQLSSSDCTVQCHPPHQAEHCSNSPGYTRSLADKFWVVSWRICHLSTLILHENCENAQHFLNILITFNQYDVCMASIIHVPMYVQAFCSSYNILGALQRGATVKCNFTIVWKKYTMQYFRLNWLVICKCKTVDQWVAFIEQKI